MIGCLISICNENRPSKMVRSKKGITFKDICRKGVRIDFIAKKYPNTIPVVEALGNPIFASHAIERILTAFISLPRKMLKYGRILNRLNRVILILCVSHNFEESGFLGRRNGVRSIFRYIKRLKIRKEITLRSSSWDKQILVKPQENVEVNSRFFSSLSAEKLIISGTISAYTTVVRIRIPMRSKRSTSVGAIIIGKKKGMSIVSYSFDSVVEEPVNDFIASTIVGRDSATVLTISAIAPCF